MLIERLPDPVPVQSIAIVDATILQMLKQHCALPDDPTWTERDALLSMYLDAAERWIDDQSGSPYRPRSFRISLASLEWTTIRLPIFPIADDPAFSWFDSDGIETELELGLDFAVSGQQSIGPTITLLPEYHAPAETNGVSYPFRILVTTSADEDSLVQKMAMLQLATYYYKNPEAMGQAIPDLSQAFYATLNNISGSIL